MAKATIIKDLGNGQYTIKRNWAGREGVQTRIDAFNSEADKLESQWEGMPQTTDEELFEKHIVQLQFTSLRKKAEYLENNMPEDAEVDAWCADHTEGLTGEVGTIDIAGEYTADVNIQPGYNENGDYDGERDGELYPAIALGPWTSLLNQMIYPGWQKFAPLHRYATIIEGSIDYTNNTCAVAVQPTFSLMNYYVNRSATGGGDEPAAGGIRSNRVKNYNVNRGDILGQDQIDIVLNGIEQKNKKTIDVFIQNEAMAHPGFINFVERYPDHPISKVGRLNDPIYITDEQFVQVARICRYVDYWFWPYKSDRSGYGISDFWDVMYDIGDTWYWIPISPKTGIHRPEDIAEIKANPPAQTEFFFGSVPLEYHPSEITGMIEVTAEQYLLYGTYLRSNVDLQVQADRSNPVGPIQKRKGDCEDYVLTKMQMIIEAGILPASSLQVMLCYVVNAGYHAVLGIQTVNRGFLISDQRDYGQIWEIEQLKDTHVWESMSISTQ
jgi:predicted transglutaminase-like cysteine proteinase